MPLDALGVVEGVAVVVVVAEAEGEGLPLTTALRVAAPLRDMLGEKLAVSVSAALREKEDEGEDEEETLAVMVKAPKALEVKDAEGDCELESHEEED